MAGIPAEQVSQIDQAASYASTDPAKAEEIYREILSKKAGEHAEVVVKIEALISSRRGWTAGSRDGFGEARSVV
jgi:DNA-directed RNA polymerase subunit F